MELLWNKNFPKTKIRKCKNCGELKECKWQSSFSSTGNPEYRTQCSECFSKYLSKLRKEKRNYYTRYKKKCAEKKKLKAIEYLGGKCEKCGYKKCKRALTFHHRERKLKEGNLSLMFQNYNWEKIRKELDKCILVCFNCHMEIEENYNLK